MKRIAMIAMGLSTLKLAADGAIGNQGSTPTLSPAQAEQAAKAAAAAQTALKEQLKTATAAAQAAKKAARLAANPNAVSRSASPKEATVLENARSIIVQNFFSDKASAGESVEQLKGLLVVAEVINAGKAPVLKAALEPVQAAINANIAKIGGTVATSEVASAKAAE